jgi:formate-dependent nitrite reductase membrane component NrfD
MNSTSEERPRRPHLFVAPIGLPLGLLFLVLALSRPTIANMRFHDLMFLLMTGVMLGAGLAGLVVFFVVRRKG